MTMLIVAIPAGLALLLLAACARGPVDARPSVPAADSALASLVIRRDSGEFARLADTDRTDHTNYQAAGWWMRGNDVSSRGRSRFSAGYERFISGVLVLRLDTLTERERPAPPFDVAPADSVAVHELRELDRVADNCRVRSLEPDERIMGVIPDTTPGNWMRPRLAWLVDTLASRLMPLRTDSLSCWLVPDLDR